MRIPSTFEQTLAWKQRLDVHSWNKSPTRMASGSGTSCACEETGTWYPCFDTYQSRTFGGRGSYAYPSDTCYYSIAQIMYPHCGWDTLCLTTSSSTKDEATTRHSSI